MLIWSWSSKQPSFLCFKPLASQVIGPWILCQNPDLMVSFHGFVHVHYQSSLFSKSQTTPKPQILDRDPHILKCTNSISTHMRNGHCHLALRVFNAMPYRNLFSWNLLLTGYVKNHKLSNARNLFDLLPHKDIVSWNTMLSGYVRSGCVDKAKLVFDNMPYKDSITWNGLFAVYVQNGRLQEARRLFGKLFHGIV